jgi:hypothetical protein
MSLSSRLRLKHDENSKQEMLRIQNLLLSLNHIPNRLPNGLILLSSIGIEGKFSSQILLPTKVDGDELAL